MRIATGRIAMLKKISGGWMPLCLLAVACAPANKVAEELDADGGADTGSPSTPSSDRESDPGTDEPDTDETTDTDSPSTPSSDPVADAGQEDECRAGGGNQPCVSVRNCETGCGTDKTCLGACRDSLCTSHEKEYCDMVDCIGITCGTICRDLGSARCLTCVTRYCIVELTACTSAAVCKNGNR